MKKVLRIDFALGHHGRSEMTFSDETDLDLVEQGRPSVGWLDAAGEAPGHTGRDGQAPGGDHTPNRW